MSSVQQGPGKASKIQARLSLAVIMRKIVPYAHGGKILVKKCFLMTFYLMPCF